MSQAVHSIEWLKLYLVFNVLLVMAFSLLWQTRRLRDRNPLSVELRLHYGIFCLVCGMTLGLPLMPESTGVGPLVKQWLPQAGPRLQSFATRAEGPLAQMHAATNHDRIAWIWWFEACVAGLLLFNISRFLKDLFRLQRLHRGSLPLRRLRRVEVYFSRDLNSAISFWWWGRAVVILPVTLLASRAGLRIVLAHELQDHRQGDTAAVYVFWFLRQICLANPAVYLWCNWLTEIQEFACDEALVQHQQVDAQEYARCLVEAAQTVIDSNSHPVCATGLVFRRDRKFLTRRIEKMLAPEKSPKSWRTLACAIVVGSFVTATAFASRGVRADRHVSMEQAQTLLTGTANGSGFPLVLNEAVLKSLNATVGSGAGRAAMRSALHRMNDLRPMLEGKLKEFGAPEELLAIPLVESGYQNLAESHRHGVGAGLWMFIASTARHFGLTVNPHVDQRLNVTLETDAALRYLLANKLAFNDWSLAILAYNLGENALAEAIERLGTRDPWVLIQHGVEGDKGYLARVMASVLILKNPDLLN